MINLNRVFTAVIIAVALLINGCSESSSPKYRRAGLPVEQRVNDLLKRMTLKEKVQQLILINSKDFWESDDELDTATVNRVLADGAGMVSPPDISLSPRQTAIRINALQKYLVEETRLGIPAFIYGEGLHGYVGAEATSFPNPLALGNTWDTALVRKVYSTVAAEMRSRGVNQALSPVLGLGREPRWGRIEETFGEDPYHVSRIGLAAIQGFQGTGITGEISTGHVAATAKHYAVHSQPEGGRNVAPGNYSQRVIMENFLLPFETAVKEGHVRCLMASYNEIDGIPSHANSWLLRDVLIKNWGHTGYVVGDLGGVEDLYTLHCVAADSVEAARTALSAGVDLELIKGNGCYPSLVDQSKKGRIDEKLIDDAVRRVLRVKFQLGLFENPYADPGEAESLANNDEHSALAEKAAEEAVVLLKNENNLLPLDADKIKMMAIIGPDAGEVHLGGYSFEPRYGTGIFEGLKKYARGKFAVRYAEGCQITKGDQASFWDDGNPVLSSRHDDETLMEQAVQAAEASDVVMMVLGGNESTCREAWSESHLGDRASLDLPGRQNELFERVVATGKPVVVLIIGGRPLSVNEVAKRANALFQGFYPGQETGNAFARVLFGEVNPSGKLAVTIPRSVGQLPVYYNHKPSRIRSYLWEEEGPLFPFGYGQSYTTYNYSEINLSDTVINRKGSLEASVNVTNTGNMAGDEIVQLYIRDDVSSVTRPVLELKDFARINIKPGETKRVAFTITPEKLRFYNIEMKRVVEPGQFHVFIGPDSQHLKSAIFMVKGKK